MIDSSSCWAFRVCVSSLVEVAIRTQVCTALKHGGDRSAGGRDSAEGFSAANAEVSPLLAICLLAGQ